MYMVHYVTWVHKIWVLYMTYVLFRGAYQFLVPIAT